jgi:alkylation response protein AidB-like acyl-CoA dehydrogenase
VTLEHYNNASVRFSTSRLYRDIAVDTLLDGTLNHQIGILLGRANDEVTVEG